MPTDLELAMSCAAIQNSRLHAAAAILAMCGACAPAGGQEDSPSPEATSEPMTQDAANRLTADEAAEGFQLLFDGQALEAWRGFRREDLPANWAASEGTLAFAPGEDGGDIITRDTYTDFDLRLEWRVGPAGNSGVFFGVVENHQRTYESGPEMQILDNAGHRDGQNPLTSAGSNYGLHAPSSDMTRPVGEWNEVRIVRHGNRVEHWLNGTRVVEYELGSDAWNALVADSKFVEWPEYGIHHEGHIGLQDHGDPVSFRSIRIRELEP